MKRLVLSAVFLVVLAPAAFAVISNEVYQESVTKNTPLVFTFSHGAGTAATLGIQALWERENTTVVHLDVTGPAECNSTVDAVTFYIDCYIPDAPLGTYTATISVDAGKLHDVTLYTRE